VFIATAIQDVLDKPEDGFVMQTEAGRASTVAEMGRGSSFGA
jgi:hypothetical protein